jgi:hypothetical protein
MGRKSPLVRPLGRANTLRPECSELPRTDRTSNRTVRSVSEEGVAVARQARITRNINEDGWVTRFLQGSGPVSSPSKIVFFDSHGPERPSNSDDERSVKARALVNPTDHRAPSLVSTRYAPNAAVGLHCHDAAQIILVVEGELRQGNRVVKEGQGYYTPAGSFYGFTAGPQGVRTLEFRPTSLDFSTDFVVEAAPSLDKASGS